MTESLSPPTQPSSRPPSLGPPPRAMSISPPRALAEPQAPQYLPLASRALAVALDASAALALLEVLRLVWRAPPLRTLADFTQLFFVATGCIVPVAWIFAVGLLAVFAPTQTHARALRWLAAALVGATIALWLVAFGAQAQVPLALGMLVLGVAARACVGRVAGSRDARRALTVLALGMAVGVLSWRHAARVYVWTEGFYTRIPLSLVARLRGGVPVPSETSVTAPTLSPAGAQSVVLFSVDAFPTEQWQAPSPALALLARNSVRLLDARMADDDDPARSLLGSEIARFSVGGTLSSAHYARCPVDLQEPNAEQSAAPCVTAALRHTGQLFLWLDLRGVPSLLSESREIAALQRALGALDRIVGFTLRATHARTPLSESTLGFVSAGGVQSRTRPTRFGLGDDRTRASLLLSSRGVAPGTLRGAVSVRELFPTLVDLASRRPPDTTETCALGALVRRQCNRENHAVRAVLTSRSTSPTIAVFTQRYALAIDPTVPVFSLVDLSLDPGEWVVRTDALLAIARAMAARAEVPFR
ncbi:MAG: hypothetical protein Q8Q09_25210 [Deltaproteobacteria bacterium]|nr:hypothetical protein [Deltaproteobacteria bacterium]